MNIEKITSPFTLVLFGASGDLAQLMLFPGLYELAEQKRFPGDFHILGFARTAKSDEEFRKEFADSVRRKYGDRTDETILDELITHVSYFTGDYANVTSFLELRKKLDALHGEGPQTVVAYFSVPPSAFKPIVANLASTRASKDDDIRLVLEKPFGSDLASSEDLIYFTLNHFKEEQLFLLDHYLGKSAVRSLVNLRRHNRVFDLLIEGEQIDNIQISGLEGFGIKERVGYFDQVGMIRDYVQSHMLQMIAITAMNLPVSESAAAFQREKNSILSALCFDPKVENAVLGQYASYRGADPKVATSTTETFVALKLGIDRENWFNVPIYLRTGKAVEAKRTYIAVEFKKLAFQDPTDPPNRLIVELHPQERVSLTLYGDKRRKDVLPLPRGAGAPESNEGATAGSLALSDSLACMGDDCLPPHALFLLDVFLGRRNFFLSFPEVVAAWKLTEKILSFTRSGKVHLETYPDGSTGPRAATDMIERDGRKWFEL